MRGAFKSDYYNKNDERYSGKKYLKSDHPIEFRDYWLFAALADVRNGIGWAGIITGAPIEPIAYPRGLPDDISTELYEGTKTDPALWLGEHTYSYLTLRELSDYDWEQECIIYGYCRFEEYVLWKSGTDELPKTYCDDIFAKSIVKIDEEYARKILDNPLANHADFKHHYVRFAASVPLNKVVGWFLENGLRGLKRLARKKRIGMDDVRIVFGFDS